MIQEVGFDNLPNSYIRLIEITELSAFVNKINIHVIVKDIKKDGLFSWYNRDELGKYLKLFVVASTNAAINSAIDNGEIPLDRMKISKHPDYNKRQVRFREIKIGWDKKQILDDGIQTPDGELFEMEYGERFKFRSSERNLKVYCATFIDTAEFAKDYRLDLTHQEINSYTGPVASEVVFDGGQVVTTTFMFRNAQNAIWSGPTRFIDGTYYSGSSGGVVPSEALTRIKHPNMKIKDYRTLKLVRTEPSYVDKKLPPFPPPYYSYNPDGSLSTLFTVDLRALLLRKSGLANRLAIVDESLLDKVIKNIKITKLIVTKHKASLMDKKFKPLVNTSDDSPYNLKPFESKMARFEEVVVSTNPNVRHFALRDYEDYTTKGKYHYKLQIEFIDPTKSFIDSIAKEVRKNLSLLKNYVEIGELPRNQNKTRTRFTDNFVNKQMAKFPLEQQPWNIAARLFATYYSMFLNLDESKVRRLIASSISKIHPIFATPLSSKIFLKEYSSLHRHFIKYLKPRMNRVSNLKGGTSKGKSGEKNKIFAMKMYKEPIMHDERDNTVIYYNFEEDIFPAVTIKELLQRSTNEKDKFFSSTPSLNGTSLYKSSKLAAEKLSKDANNMIGFLTPESIKANKTTLDLSTPSAVDIDSFNSVFERMSAKKETTKEAPIRRKVSKLNIKMAKKIDKYIEEPKEETKTIENNLGKNSKFRSAEESYKPTITSKVVKSIKQKVRTKKMKKISVQQYKPDSENIKELIKTVNDVRLPPSLISVIASESTSTRNNALTSKIDLVANPSSRHFFSLMYTNPIQIETIKGYVKDLKGRDIYGKPIWGILTEQELATTIPIICRFKYFNTKMFEIEELETNISNEIFILLPNSTISKNFTVGDTITPNLITNFVRALNNNQFDYHTTNPVRQSLNKNGPLR